MTNELKDFCRNYEVNVLNDTKRRACYRKPNFFQQPEDAAVIHSSSDYKSERIFTIEIPEGRFRALVEMEQRFFKWQQHSSREIDMFQTLMDKEREEAYYRSTNTAVQNAWKQYSTMLHLAGYEKKF